MKSRAIVFAGQGAQAPGMGRDLAEAYPECKALFVRADEVLGYSLSKICFDGPAEELTKTIHCQPGIFVTSTACYAALSRDAGNIQFAGAAGLSLGEWSALHMAGVLSFDDTLRVLAARGKFMQEACEERQGGMVSVIGLAPDRLQEVCRQAGVEMANLNSEEQTVLSGDKQAIAQAEQLAKAAGAKKTVMLNVAGAYHSSLMASAAKKLETFLAGVTFHAPLIPVVSNVTGEPHGVNGIREVMVRQVTSSVRWLSTVQWFKANGVGMYVECGPGKVLSGLIKRIDRECQVTNVQDAATLKEAVGAVNA